MNGYPSLKLASMAAEHKPSVPVYIVCDSPKICIDLIPHVIEAGFDLIQDNLINGIVTENGLIKGEEITDCLNRHKKES